jgi:hypothetical protein
MPQKPNYLQFAFRSLLLSGFILIGLPYLLWFWDRGAGGFKVDKFNTLALSALLFIGCIHLAFFGFRRLFPRFYDYMRECLEGEGKLFENLTSGLTTDLDSLQHYVQKYDMLPVIIERRKVAQLQLLIRCVRLSFCLLVLFGLLYLASHMLTVAFLAMPGQPAANVL